MNDSTINVNKTQLIVKIKENKAAHIKAYQKAVTAYKAEALKQLKELTEKVKKGELNVRLDLISPVDNTEKYDKLLKMFEWEVNDEVSLTQYQFNEYILDETTYTAQALYSNTAYLRG